MKLFHVQDSDRPMYVVATSFQHAVELWKLRIMEENPEDCPTPDDVNPPNGVSYLAGANDLLIP